MVSADYEGMDHALYRKMADKAEAQQVNRGDGVVTQRRYPLKHLVICSLCAGRGDSPSRRFCSLCNGYGYITREQRSEYLYQIQDEIRPLRAEDV